MKDHIYVFTGENSFLINERTQEWIKKFYEKYKDNAEVTILDVEKHSAEEIVDSLCTLPFLIEKRLLIVKGLPLTARLSKKYEKKEAHVAKILNTIPENNIVVFQSEQPDKRKSFYKNLKKQGCIEEFKYVQGAQLVNWIVKEGKGGITKDLAYRMVEIHGTDMWILHNEIEKLLLYRTGETIIEEDLLLLSKGKTKDTIFQLTDSISERKTRKSLEYFHHLLEQGEDLFMVQAMLARHMRIMYAYKKASNKEVVQKALKLHPFVAKKLRGQIEGFTLQALEKHMTALLDMDTQTKSGGIKISAQDTREMQVALERFIVSVCEK